MGLDPLDYGIALNAAGTSYVNLEDGKYEKIELLGKTALFSNDHLTDADIPEGLYCYHLRRSDDSGSFCAVESKCRHQQWRFCDPERAAGVWRKRIYPA